MVKRLTAGLLGMLLLFSMRIPAAALGFYDIGGYTDTNTRAYAFDTDTVWQEYNRDVTEYPNFAEIWAGSVLYLPVVYINMTGDGSGIATDKMVKDDKVEISYVVTHGAQFIESIQLVDGKREKIPGIPSGTLVRIQTTNNYSGIGYAQVELKLVLSVNNVSYQETRVELACEITNREETIDNNSVYGAKVPTKFKVDSRYNGTAAFDMGDGITYSAYVRPSARYLINLNRDPDPDIAGMYPDAYLEYYNFLGDNSTFASVGSLQIPIDKGRFNNEDVEAPRVYAYEILKNQQLRALGSDVASYDSRNSVLTIRTSQLDNYVLSNYNLFMEVDDLHDDTFQSGFATWEEPITDAVEQSQPQQEQPQQTQTQQSQPQQTQLPAPTVTQQSNTLTTPPTTPVSDRPPILEPERLPTVINASNSRGENPLTGGGPPYGAMLVALVVLPVCVWVWKKKPFGKRK